MPLSQFLVGIESGPIFKVLEYIGFPPFTDVLPERCETHILVGEPTPSYQ